MLFGAAPMSVSDLVRYFASSHVDGVNRRRGIPIM